MNRFKKYIKIFMLLGTLSLTYACSSDDVSSTSIFGEPTTDNSEFGQWLRKNYEEPYNIEFNYLYNDKLSDNTYNVIPADVNKAKALAILLKHVWLDAYKEVGGEDFLKKHCFRVIQLIGSPEYNSQGSIVLGTAESGIQITLFNVNALTPNDVFINQDEPYRSKAIAPLDLNYWFFHTMHHEFSHILHQTIDFSTEYQTISAGKYHASDWVNVKDSVAPQEGFVTGYGSGEVREDFAELYSTYVTSSDKAWQSILDHGSVPLKDANGNLTYEVDANGNPVYITDGQGYPLPQTDQYGGFVPETDANGKIVYALDKKGNRIYYLDKNGNRIPKYSMQKEVVYTVDEAGNDVAYFVFQGQFYPISVKAGNPVYQTTETGDTVYDSKGNPMPEYYCVPEFALQRKVRTDDTGRNMILQKLDIMRTYFKDNWNIDLDKMREVVLRRSKEAATLDLKTLK